MSSNGHEPTGAPVAAALMPPPPRVRSRKTADLSSAERSELMDALVAQMTDLVRAHNALGKAHQETTDNLRKDVDNLNERTAHTYTDLRALESELEAFTCRTFWQRLRWVLVGR